MVSDYMSLICKNLGVKPSYNSFGGYILMFSSPISPKSQKICQSPSYQQKILILKNVQGAKENLLEL